MVKQCTKFKDHKGDCIDESHPTKNDGWYQRWKLAIDADALGTKLCNKKIVVVG